MDRPFPSALVETHTDAPDRLRLSNYTIFVELDEVKTLLIHGYSGAWDIVTSDSEAAIRSYRRGPEFKPLIGRAFSNPKNDDKSSFSGNCLDGAMVEYLTSRGYLTDLSVREEQEHVNALAAGLHRISRFDPPAYVFALTYSCNLRCSYCFQDALRSRPEHRSRLALMSVEMVDRIFAAMPQVEARHGFSGKDARGRPGRSITLFGGEPLLAFHHDLVKYILERAKSDGSFSCLAVTNGTELHHYQDLIGPEKISFLQVTLDGPPAVHDKRRIGHDKLPTFDRIADNIDLALGLGAQVKVRINTDQHNVVSLPEITRVFDARGWFEAPNFSAYVTPVHESAGSGHDACGFGSWSLTSELAALAREHPRVGKISGPDTHWERRVREILRGGLDPLLNMKPSFCGAHAQTWVFDAFGDIYACWERAGYLKDRIGRLSSDAELIMDDRVERAWRGRTVTANPVCGRCPYAFYCGGGCALLAERANGAMNSNYCDDFSRRFKALAAAEVVALERGALMDAVKEIYSPE
jgi:uncharacterized protein